MNRRLVSILTLWYLWAVPGSAASYSLLNKGQYIHAVGSVLALPAFLVCIPNDGSCARTDCTTEFSRAEVPRGAWVLCISFAAANNKQYCFLLSLLHSNCE
ncbi:hypothetical protein IW261DRAFT_273665 [Armillaria novae-zelandiae]|uniref:Secreted protein n=1 Tax=Armillaria novae-zelandiae TaxID=153914 RepID=A0AA39TJ63_9AGAR|nr:hypothetical protein IW261DRAFT_273665 [Armillaria novae-zelandiae]